MPSEVRTTKEGGRFLWVAYNNTLSNWNECIADAHNKHPGPTQPASVSGASLY